MNWFTKRLSTESYPASTKLSDCAFALLRLINIFGSFLKSDLLTPFLSRDIQYVFWDNIYSLKTALQDCFFFKKGFCIILALFKTIKVDFLYTLVTEKDWNGLFIWAICYKAWIYDIHRFSFWNRCMTAIDDCHQKIIQEINMLRLTLIYHSVSNWLVCLFACMFLMK